MLFLGTELENLSDITITITKNYKPIFSKLGKLIFYRDSILYDVLNSFYNLPHNDVKILKGNNDPLIIPLIDLRNSLTHSGDIEFKNLRLFSIQLIKLQQQYPDDKNIAKLIYSLILIYKTIHNEMTIVQIIPGTIDLLKNIKNSPLRDIIKGRNVLILDGKYSNEILTIQSWSGTIVNVIDQSGNKFTISGNRSVKLL